MCTAAVSRTAALSSRVAHPPPHRPPCHATGRCRWQARTGASSRSHHTQSSSAPHAPPRVARAPCARALPPSHVCAAAAVMPYVRAARARVVVLENVDEPDAVAAITQSLSTVSAYFWRSQTLSPKTHAGIPARRERRFFVGMILLSRLCRGVAPRTSTFTPSSEDSLCRSKIPSVSASSTAPVLAILWRTTD